MLSRATISSCTTNYILKKYDFALINVHSGIMSLLISFLYASVLIESDQNILDLTSENEEKIPVEKAVCKFCSKTFETGNMFKAKCMCPNALTHEECILNWSGVKGNNECDVCEQEVQSFSVDWHLVVSNQLQKPIKRGWISRLKRYSPLLLTIFIFFLVFCFGI